MLIQLSNTFILYRINITQLAIGINTTIRIPKNIFKLNKDNSFLEKKKINKLTQIGFILNSIITVFRNWVIFFTKHKAKYVKSKQSLCK